MSKDEEDAKALLDSVSSHDEMCEWDKCDCLERVRTSLRKAREEAWEEGRQTSLENIQAYERSLNKFTPGVSRPPGHAWVSNAMGRLAESTNALTNPYTPRSGSKGEGK